MDKAIEVAFPETEIQQCVIYKIRNSTRFVSYKDLKPLMADLKSVYQVFDERTALSNLGDFQRYPHITKSWKENWVKLSLYFKYP